MFNLWTFFLHKNLFKQKFLRAIPLVFLGLYTISFLIMLKTTYHTITGSATNHGAVFDKK